MSSRPISLRSALADAALPMPMRRKLLLQLATHPTPETDAVLDALLDGWNRHEADEVARQKMAEAQELLDGLRHGALRTAVFDALVEASAGVGRRAKVLLGDGGTAYPTVPDPRLAAQLRRGEIVLLDAQGQAILHATRELPATGEVARLERDLGEGRIEISRHGDSRRDVCRASDLLAAQLASGEVATGASLLVCMQRGIAFSSLPSGRDVQGSDLLLRRPPPDVLVARDLAEPRPFLASVLAHVRREMQRPALPRRYRITRSRTVLLTGVSGSGKSMHVQALHRALYDLMAEVTGAALDELPHRVFRIGSAMLLSKWLGESDQRIARCFDEIEELARRKWRDPRGREHELPVLVIMEEADGLARERGADAVHDRIQTTLLDRLDATTQSLRERLVVFVFSTNVPHLVDSAFLRRAGGTVESFGRLTRRSLAAVLDRRIAAIPIAGVAHDDGARRKALVGEVAAWLWGRDADPGQVELTFAGTAATAIKYRRDFLTAGLVDRAVQEAAAEACEQEEHGVPPFGLRAEQVQAAIARHVRHVCDQLQPQNAASYLTLQDGERVAGVRRLAVPRVASFEIERVETSPAREPSVSR